MGQVSQRPQVWAPNIIQALANSTNETYCLSNAIVRGKLRLKDLVIKCAVEIVGCEFLDEVDVVSSVFEQAVDFSNTVFHKKFGSGEIRTVYKKDLTCKGTQFKGGASFVGLCCEGKANFSKATFGKKADALNKDNDGRVSFEAATFGLALECEETIFWLGAIFKGIQSKGYGNFQKAKFRNQVEVTFEFASFGTIFSCAHAEFNGGAKFSGMKCTGHGFFESVRFENKESAVSFRAATFGGTINFKAARFKGPVTFNALECRYGSFEAARFKSEKSPVDFTYTSLAIGIDCEKAMFRGSANFNSLQCGGAAQFNRARFAHKTNPASFRFSSIAQAINFKRALFLGPADFTGMKCGGPADFTDCKFQSESPIRTDFKSPTVDFGFSLFGLSLDFTRATFMGEVSLSASSVLSTLTLSGTKFCKIVLFNKATLGILKIELTRPFDVGADLRDCRIAVFDLEKDKWKEILASQGSNCFSRDPYLQLEGYYQKIGSEYEARKVYYEGRNRSRSRAKVRGNNIVWSPGNWINDSVLKWLTGYGVQTWRLLILLVLLLGTSIAIFWSPSSLKAKPSATAVTATNSTSVSPQQAPPTAPTQATRLERLVYPVDLFIPVVKLDVADQWQPIPEWRRIYSVFHRILGWLLIPLLVASIAGIVRRQ
jgi:hypothetical protein